MIYCLEDDDGIRNLIAYTLRGSGMEARSFALPSEFRAAVQQRAPELVLLDIMLPEEDGLSVLRSLRADPRTERVPVILLTAKTAEYDRIVGLDSGADDYVTKPFSVMELMARVRALLRRAGDAPECVYRAGELTVDTREHAALAGGREVALTLKEFQLLCFLLQNRGTVLTRDVILNEVWGYAFDGENRTVDVHIRSLRAKLGAAGNVIETVRGVGYKISK